MKITVRNNSGYKDVSLEEGNTKIDLGMHDTVDSEYLAEEFLRAVDDLMSSQFDSRDEFIEWIKGIV
jgi:hypothetical protein